MKTNCLLSFALFFLFYGCKKETPATAITSIGVDNKATTSGPVNTPKVVLASTTKTQFIANADGNGYSDFTLSFSSKRPGISILDFGFAAYETNNHDALYVVEVDQFGGTSGPAFFNPSDDHTAGTLLIAGLHRLPDDGSSITVTFRMYYTVPSDTGRVKSGDTVSVQLTGIDYISNTRPSVYPQPLLSPVSPEMMITGSKPALGLNIFDPDVLHVGLTRIFQTEYDSYGGSLGINNLPLVIKLNNTKIKNNLVVKDENNQTINTTTIRNGNNYTIQFPAGYKLNGVNVHNFYVYAQVTSITGQASVSTSLQPASKFSWTDITGGRTTPYTIENATYYYNYPVNMVTTTHN